MSTTTNGKDIGRNNNYTYHLITCVKCGKQRWLRGKKHYSPTCKICNLQNRSGENNYRWKGGRRPDGHGYIIVKLPKDSPYRAMCRHGQNGYVPEHRLVMAQYLGRCLEPWEIVHHKNHDKTDNRIANLELLPSHDVHLSDSVQIILINKFRKQVQALENRVVLLEADNTSLCSQIEELSCRRQD